MRLVWSPESQRVLAEIREEIMQSASDDRATAVIERIVDRALLLLHAPRMGRVVGSDQRSDLRVIPIRPRWMYYRIQPDTIEIISIKHYRQEDALRVE